VGGDEVHGRDQFGVLDPGAPDFAGGDRYAGFALDALDLANQLEFSGVISSIMVKTVHSGLSIT
jgi:hypothetical protein